jgi:putative transcriptional regulator
MKLCNRVKETRLQRQHTQESLAAAVGVTRQTIIAIEKGRFGPSVRLALKLASALDVSLEEMFWLEDNEGEKRSTTRQHETPSLPPC